MLLVTFKNGNVPCRYFCNCRVNFKIAQGHLSNLRNTLCGVGSIFCNGDRLDVACQFKEMAISACKISGSMSI